MVRHCTCRLYFTRRWLVKYKGPLVPRICTMVEKTLALGLRPRVRVFYNHKYHGDRGRTILYPTSVPDWSAPVTTDIIF